jgi:predicted patatin/cPLA2 family phospholipase
MKKLSKTEVSTLANVVNERISKEKEKVVKEQIRKSKEFKEYEKIYKEYDILSEKLRDMSTKMNDLHNSIRGKHGDENANIWVSGNKGVVSIHYQMTHDIQREIYNTLVIKNIGKDFDVEATIKELVEKFK